MPQADQVSDAIEDEISLASKATTRTIKSVCIKCVAQALLHIAVTVHKRLGIAALSSYVNKSY